MPRVVIPVKDEILQAARRRQALSQDRRLTHFLSELINLGFEYRLQQWYQRFAKGEISLGYFAQEMGLGIRDLYAALEQRGLQTSNIGTD